MKHARYKILSDIIQSSKKHQNPRNNSDNMQDSHKDNPIDCYGFMQTMDQTLKISIENNCSVELIQSQSSKKFSFGMLQADY